MTISTTDAGRLGEIKAMAALTEQGYYVFPDISGKCPIDFIAWKDGNLFTYQVKATSYSVGGSWIVQIKTVRPNRTTNVIKGFDNTVSDFLAVYIIPEDRVIFLKSSEITQISAIPIKKMEDAVKVTNKV